MVIWKLQKCGDTRQPENKGGNKEIMTYMYFSICSQYKLLGRCNNLTYCELEPRSW